MEKFIYESRPYLYGALSFYALILSHNSALMVACGIALAVCCVWVLNRRTAHRAQEAIIARKMKYAKKR